MRENRKSSQHSEDSILTSPTKLSDRNWEVSLHDELMEATVTQLKDDPFWQREMNLHQQLQKHNACITSRTYSVDGRPGISSRKVNEKSMKLRQDSSSPEQHTAKIHPKLLRDRINSQVNTRSKQFNAATEKEFCTLLQGNSNWKALVAADIEARRRTILFPKDNNGIVVRLVMPSSPTPHDQTDRRDNSTSKSEADTCGGPLRSESSSLHFTLPLSDLPTSNTTVEIAKSPEICDSAGDVLRTLSAPGLLESEWIEKYKLCEMKDCSTNT